MKTFTTFRRTLRFVPLLAVLALLPTSTVAAQDVMQNVTVGKGDEGAVDSGTTVRIVYIKPDDMCLAYQNKADYNGDGKVTFQVPQGTEFIEVTYHESDGLVLDSYRIYLNQRSRPKLSSQRRR